MNSPLLMWEWIALDCWFEARPQHCEKIWCAAYLSYNVHNFNVHTINTDSCLNGIRCFVVRKLHQPRCCWTGATQNYPRVESVRDPRFLCHAKENSVDVKLLRSKLKEQSNSDEGLLTLMCEVESVLNNRPLTPVTDDPTDPNHLLLMRKRPVCLLKL